MNSTLLCFNRAFYCNKKDILPFKTMYKVKSVIGKLENNIEYNIY